MDTWHLRLNQLRNVRKSTGGNPDDINDKLGQQKGGVFHEMKPRPILGAVILGGLAVLPRPTGLLTFRLLGR